MNRQERAGRTQRLQSARRVLAALRQLAIERPNYRPSVRELAVLAGLHQETVCNALATLRDDYGYITQGDAVSCAAPRTIRLIEQTY